MELTKREILDNTALLFTIDEWYLNWLNANYEDDELVGVQINDDGSVELFEI